jgi:hypothetical protein
MSDKEFLKLEIILEEQCGRVKDQLNKLLINEGVNADWFKR